MNEDVFLKRLKAYLHLLKKFFVDSLSEETLQQIKRIRYLIRIIFNGFKNQLKNLKSKESIEFYFDL